MMSIGQRATSANVLNVGLNIKMFGNRITDIGEAVDDTDAISKGGIKGVLLDMIYPVGSIYMSTKNTSPKTFLGGEWTQIAGRFLYCLPPVTMIAYILSNLPLLWTRYVGRIKSLVPEYGARNMRYYRL